MNVRTIYLGGVPASGKSTLFRDIRETLMPGATAFRHGLCRGVERGPYKMLGVFDGSTFEGTDKLSMCVIDDALDYIRALERAGSRAVVFAEGDRLFCERFLRETRAEAYIIEAYAHVLRRRRAGREANGEGQADFFLKSKRTKVENLRRKCGISSMWNNAPGDRGIIAGRLIGRARKWIEAKP